MKNYILSFDNIRKNGDLLFESIRGSHLFGLETEKSDIDTFGLFCCPLDYLLDTRRDFKDVIFSDKCDDAWYEIEKFVIGLGKSNPNYLEALFTPPQHILHFNPVLQPLWDIRDSLLTKESFKSFGNYAISQIRKAKGLKKAINTDPNEVKVRKSVLDYCFVPYHQGVKKLKDWLTDNGLMQKYCGLVLLPNTHDTYGLYYDWGTHLICEYQANLKDKSSLKNVWDKLCKESDNWDDDNTCCFSDSLVGWGFTGSCNIPYLKQLESVVPYGFTGIINENSDTNEPRVCKVPKNIQPLITVSYNRTGYESHCKDYKRYWDWVENRNPERFELNKGYNFDAKNMSTCIRIMTCAKEIAQGKGLLLDRTNIDREFLLSIKNHQKTYDEVIEYAENLEREMTDAFSKSELPESPDLTLLDDILIEIRKSHYKLKTL